MQVVNFDFWGAFLSLLLVFGTCSAPTTQAVSVPTDATSLNLVSPKEEPGKYNETTTKLTLILLKDGEAYAYEGTDAGSGRFYEKKELHHVIRNAKQKFPADEFVVVIKPTGDANYAGTVDVLDEMVVQKIDRYSIENLTSSEQRKLNGKDRTDN